MKRKRYIELQIDILKNDNIIIIHVYYRGVDIFMKIEGFWYYLFAGVFEAATIHYAVAKIFGPLIFGRGWCGYACWTAMVLDLLPYKIPKNPRKKIGWIRYITFSASLIREKICSR